MTTPVGSEAEAPVAGDSSTAAVIDVSRSIPAPVGRVWQLLVSPEGTHVWLGDGAVLGGKGEPYHCTDGTSGVVRSYHPLEQLRVSWHASPDSPPTIVEVDLRSDGDSTRIDLRHDRIDDDHLRATLQQRWSAGLQALARRAADGG
jgi:uncharacterized protein YndB with AHSA1/START domain